MREPCRACGGCMQGTQCRWLFSACGRARLAVILSHVLESEVRRDGHGEFLCGKCVFSLERVVHYDVAIGQLQDAHAAQLQRLQNERDRLKMHIANKYEQHNLSKPDGGGLQKSFKRNVKIGTILPSPNQLRCIRRSEQSSVQPKLDQAAVDDKWKTPGRSQGVKTSGDVRQRKFTGHLRRCVSLEPLSRAGTDHCQCLQVNVSPRQSKDAHSGVLGNREYLSIVHKKSTLSRSTSLQSVTLERSDHSPIGAAYGRNTLKTSLVFDILQLLKIVRGVRPIPQCEGSKIPVLTPSRFTFGHAHQGVKSMAEKRLREMEEDFNDEYTPFRPEVHAHTLAVTHGCTSGYTGRSSVRLDGTFILTHKM
ncbi:uncharacterized protein LOC130569806 [Triplophysa rosa]|uniref:uncharacterized protein LOC130569806 n=1 Tax=Triplophysa rosa TaxID=992332 RepID=UPI002546306F|nr:uncharacterized protein LOC130569806 [Triplophysa rosa]